MTSVKTEGEKKLSPYQQDPYKTNFRQDVIMKRRELTRIALLNREKTQDKRQLGQSRSATKNLVTIDTHKARSNTDVVRLALQDLGWREFPFQRRDRNCDVTWHAISFHDQGDIYSGQVNKFPGSLEIFHKVNLFRWLEFMKTLFPDEYDFFPRTWFLPHQFNDFVSDVRAMNEKKPKNKPMFIVKPSEGSQGDGIYLLRDPQHYNHNNGRFHVVQEYLNNVFLVDRFKFDLRVYVVLRSLDPLEFHICNEGLARFSTIPYEQPTNKNMNETYMHLTNYSLNKKSSEFKISDKDDEGSKRKMSAVFKQMEKMGHDVTAVWEKIERLIAKTLIAVNGELKVEYQAAIPPGKPGPTCFQILGFDILLLDNLDPYLLEVNSNPSLSITEEHESPSGKVEYRISAKDEKIKRKLIRDTLILIAPKNKYTRKRRRRRKVRRRDEDEEGEEENMEVDGEDAKPRRRLDRRKEKAISIQYADGEDGSETNTSIFDDRRHNSKKFTRNETCRVFIEGEGEVVFTEEGPSNPKYFSEQSQKETPPQSGSTKNKRSNSRDRLPSLFPKIEDREKEVNMDEDENESSQQNGRRSPEASLTETTDDEEEEASCLKEIFPAVYGGSYNKQRILEKMADIFISCLGVKGTMRLGPTMFRLFARKCRLNQKGITNAAVDILYIDMQRKWEYLNPDTSAGLSFYAFVGGCCRIARTTFSGNSETAQLKNFIAHCQTFLKIPTDLELEAAARARNRFNPRRQREEEEAPGSGNENRVQVTDEWPYLLEAKYQDRTFPNPQKKYTSIFSMLQSLCFLAFVSACYELARREFYSPCKHTMLQNFLDYCEDSMKQGTQPVKPPRPRRGNKGHNPTSVSLFARNTVTSLEDEAVQMLTAYAANRQPSFFENILKQLEAAGKTQSNYASKKGGHDFIFNS
ncbi:tubulin polyglutamylase TTLL11-like [Physella acuta]|uniref:tubulin polyglutamylase TTLL11-like n=1 Tax=Physella acuta TaxID=109671 RepID=UPI0027DE7243|nr:tubulin polyglutamylase TTLL11-like [Physella acuta]